MKSTGVKVVVAASLICALTSPLAAGVVRWRVSTIEQADGTTLSHDFGSYIIGASNPTTTIYDVINKPPPGSNPANVNISKTGHATVSPLGAQLIAHNTVLGMTIGIDVSAVGLRSGQITVDRTDTSPTDLDDIMNVSAKVFDHSNASFSSGSDLDELTIDFGKLCLNNPIAHQQFQIWNLVGMINFTEALDLTGIVGFGNVSTLALSSPGVNNLGAGNASSFFDVFFDLSAVGTFSADYVLGFQDHDNLPGRGTNSLTLHLRGVVEDCAPIIPEPATCWLLGLGCAGMLMRRKLAK